MTWNNLSKYTDLGLLIFRLGFGLGFLFFHGYDKLMGGPEAWANLGGAMSMFGIGFGHTFFGFLAAFAESIGGIMIAAGLYYRPIMALLAGTMFVATLRHIISTNRALRRTRSRTSSYCSASCPWAPASIASTP